MQETSPSGLPNVPSLQWGTHMAHFFGVGHELRDVLVPYFKAGLENDERCLWVTGEQFSADDARSALRAAVPDLDRREHNRQIEIANASSWYSANDKLKPRELTLGLIQREQEALGSGFKGLRTNGNCSWVSQAQWDDFLDYEQRVQELMQGRRMICMCSYCTDGLADSAHLQIMSRHHLVVPGAGGPAMAELRVPKVVRARSDKRPDTDLLLSPELARQLRTIDLAMVASEMGTWRYTLADNICEYDHNAQRLYGLSEARFLHDEEGVKDKFHPDDLPLMWSRVEKALDPAGDGRYEVEYRVKQPDGRWRWLSAWGLVEFEGEGVNRKPVAIAGASRDLTKQKQTEDLQQLLLNELNHRVKNTFATVQAITSQTLRSATDIPAAREALEGRIKSLAQAHDLLTMRAWTGAKLTDVIARTLQTFSPSQIHLDGKNVDLSPKRALSLTLLLHELATNAAKYGALSVPEGRIDIRWKIRDGLFRWEWKETNGPQVETPAISGFGTKLLELVARDLHGEGKLAYEPSGVRYTLALGQDSDAASERDPVSTQD